jgi:ATP-dependent DNA helicase RecG
MKCKNCGVEYTIKIGSGVFCSIIYEREYKIGKFFIDFLILDKKIAIEIDGRQHEKKDRILTDLEKDKLITSSGYSVFRIKYPKENIIDRLNDILK